MNKENYHPNLYILKRREAHLSVSRSMPSIFRRKKRARSAQVQPSNHHSPTDQLKHAQPNSGRRTTRPPAEPINPDAPSKLQHSPQSTPCKLKYNTRSSLDDHQRDGRLNEEDQSLSSKHLSIRNRENYNGTHLQKLERRVIRTSGGSLAGAQLTVQRAATGTNEGNRNSKNFEDISDEIALESDHSGSSRTPESYGYAPSSQCQTVTEK